MSGNLYSHPFLIGIDSDGCAFDNMTIKHQKCFGPAFVKYYGLLPDAEFAAKIWDFVNLFGRTRGCNRFKGIVNSLKWMRKYRSKMQVDAPVYTKLEKWIATAPRLSNSALEADYKRLEAPELKRAFFWSMEVNRLIAELPPIPPVEGVKEALAEASSSADLAVISQAPFATIDKEWHKFGLADPVAKICGQEAGSKADQLLTAADGKYGDGHVLLIGDAPGDLASARTAKALFYPIVPGREKESWARFRQEALTRFLNGSFDGSYQQSLIADFESALPEEPDFV